jgi:hypothetical protein
MSKLSRRKYADLVKFLKSVIRNERMSIRVRMSAAERLDGIYQRHEVAELKRLERESKAHGATAPASDPEQKTAETGETAPGEDADQKARQLFDAILNKGRADDSRAA